MSRFQDQHHDSNSVCPYCGHSYQVESEDYSENTREDECSKCGKKYYLTQSFTVTHETRPDCVLNGAEHRWIKGRSPGFESCEECDKYRLAQSKPQNGSGVQK